MKISYNWLQEYIDLGADMTPEILGELLTNHGIPVEVIERLDKGVQDVIVGHVLQTEQHPDADRLKVCTIDAGGTENLQIVCGAPNVTAGQKVACATVGAKLPGGVKIKRAKLRGVESQGMLCSAAELGMDAKLLPKEQTEGLFILPDDAPVGESVLPILGLDDVVMELELTPNRSDCLNYRGVAYEVAAILGTKPIFAEQQVPPTVNGSDSPVRIEIESDNCIQYAAQVVTGIQVAPSPLWLQTRLLAVGVRPINNIVDVTNYVMFEYGQPLHAFDLAKITDSTIVVRQAKDGETLVTLDGQERQLDASMLTIADAQRVIGLAGVMGGENSEVNAQTADVVLESAWFDPGSTRLTGKKLGMRSEAQIRFEKGIDPAVMHPALRRAAAMVAEFGGGTLAAGPVAIVQKNSTELQVTVRVSRINLVLGTQVTLDTVESILARLEFAYTVQDQDTVIVVVPTRRADITGEVDLIEEVARLYGYDKIGTTIPKGVLTAGKLSPQQTMRRMIRDVLSGAGMYEVLTYSFTKPSWLDPLGLDESSPLRQLIPLALPMSDERKALRTMMLPSLAEVLQYNLNRKNQDLALFEIGKVFSADSLPLREQPQEHVKVAGILTGIYGSESVGEKPRKVDFFTAKGIVDTLLSGIGIPNASYEQAELPGLHPGRTAVIRAKDQVLGYVGSLHPALEDVWDLNETYYFELDLESVENAADSVIEFKSLPKFPSIQRDIALVVPLDVPAGSLEFTIRETGGELLREVRLFDVYQGEQVGAGSKSLAFSIVYRAEDRTLTDEEVQIQHDKVLAALRSVHQAELRV